MPNSYAVVPDILPGSVTIGGDLTVKGSTFKLGQNPKKYRIQELGNGDFRETVNVDKLAVTQDQPGDPSCMLRHLATLPGWQFYWQPVGNPALDNQLAKLFNTLFEVDLDTLQLGAASPFARVFKNATTDVGLSRNLAGDLLTLDNGAQDGTALFVSGNALEPITLRRTPAGAGMLRALPLALFTDYTHHTHTGTVTVDTIYSKVIRGGMIGANGGLLIRLRLSINVQGAGTTFVRLMFAGGQVDILNVTATGNWQLDAVYANRNASNSQVYSGAWLTGGAAPIVTPGGSVIDTSVDQTLAVTVVSANASDSQLFETIEVHLLNSFGPV